MCILSSTVRVKLIILPLLIVVFLTSAFALQNAHSNLWVKDGNLHVYASTVNTQRIPVLMYHALRYYDEMSEEQRNNPYIVSVEDFYRQMRYLYQNNFHTLTPDELKDFLFYDGELPARSIFIQFDDGFVCNIKRGYPILKQFGQRATIFSITSHAITPQEPFNPEILTTFISKEEMDSVRDVFTFASHSHDLHAWMDDYTQFIVASRAEIIDDLKRSFEIVDNQTIFAFPGGFYNQYSIQAIAEAGIRMAFTGEVGYVTRDCDPFRLKRFGVYNFTPFSYFREYVHVGSRNFQIYAPSVVDLHTIPDIPKVWYLRNPSADKRDYVRRANMLGLTTDVLVGQYRRYITRAEFTALIARVFERFADESVVYTLEKQFSDTNNVYVENMASIGIATGVYYTRFEPHRWITTDESLAMLIRLAETTEKLIPEDYLKIFCDSNRDSDKLTRQESIMIFVKLYDSFTKQQISRENSFIYRVHAISLKQKIVFFIPILMLFLFALIRRAKLWSIVFGLLVLSGASVIAYSLLRFNNLNELSFANMGEYVWFGVIIGSVMVLAFGGLGKLFECAQNSNVHLTNS